MELPLLAEANGIGAAEAGGKGAALARLLAAGFPVPPGFVIPAKAAAALATARPGVREAVERALTRLGLDGMPVAVRSSAVDEDGTERSFAGQHATVLGVAGVDAILEAALECIHSLESDAAAAYRAAAGATGGAAMAIVVQEMVPARAAGVAFTADPATGNRDRIVVEAVPGLGDALVAGLREPRRYIFARDGLAILAEEGAEDRPLTDAEAREAATLALRAERLFGQPQDIEFAFDDGRAWILQSRPVTGLPAPAPAGEFDTPTSEADLWTSSNIGEVLPGLLTPLTITAFAARGNDAYCRAYQGLKILGRDEFPQFVGFFFNRAFLHVGNTRLIADRAFGSNADAVERRFLGAGETLSGRRQHSWTNVRHRFLSLLPLLNMVRTIVRRGEEAEARTLAFERRVRALDPAALTGAQLDALRNEIADLVAETFAVHLQASGCAGAGYELVARLVRPLLGDQTEGTMPALFAGMRDVESARIPLDLWDLAETARRTGVAEHLPEPGFDPVAETLPAAWRSAFAAFLERHGHRGLFEMEPAEPCWRRDPAQVVSLAASFLDIDPEHAPPAVMDRREVERLRLTQELAARMNPLKRRIFARVLRDAQAWVALRERTKSVIVRGTRLVDFLVPEAARRLVEGGAIETPGDIYFITGEELSVALANRPMPDLRSAVVRRRRDFERNRHLRLPERFRGRPQPLPPGPPVSEDGVLRGTPVSPGLVTARARVILDPRSDEPLRPGEVLVAPVTDAGWTPLFALAAGLVVDMGSALSHGSTVAREYGLPAVTNVRRGTSAIRTGDLVAIDGAAGTVTIVERAP